MNIINPVVLTVTFKVFARAYIQLLLNKVVPENLSFKMLLHLQHDRHWWCKIFPTNGNVLYNDTRCSFCSIYI